MGPADVVPGVSGGSMAFIMEAYGRLLEAVAGFVRLLRWLLERWHGQTGALLAALLLGAIGVVLVVGLEWLQQRADVTEMGG
jgi:uncharacterized membrane protein